MGSWRPHSRKSMYNEEGQTRRPLSHRILTVMSWTVVVALLVGVYLLNHYGRQWAEENPFFTFRQVVVEKSDPLVPIDRIQQAVQGALEGNYVFADLDDIQQALEAVPWVKSATVRRVWPNQLVVSVQPYDVIAQYEDGRLVSKEGVLFSADPSERGEGAKRLPNFYGLVSQIQLITQYYEVFQKTLAPLHVDVTDVNYSDRGSWSLVFESKDIPPTKVELGQEIAGHSVIEQLEQVVRIYPRIRKMLYGAPGHIDVRYNQAVAVTLPDLKKIDAWKKAQAQAQDKDKHSIANAQTSNASSASTHNSN